MYHQYYENIIYFTTKLQKEAQYSVSQDPVKNSLALVALFLSCTAPHSS